MFVKLKVILIFTAAVIVSFWWYAKSPTAQDPATDTAPVVIDTNADCLLVYYAIEKYSEQYRVPKKYAYMIAYLETRYNGPFDWKYRADKSSNAGAVGPMQIMYSSAKYVWPDKKFSREQLKNDTQFNVETSMKILNLLHNKYKDWRIVFGYYNTGRPIVNQYALSVYNSKKTI
jgi:soluble lytic murein transglycosylase-like protein